MNMKLKKAMHLAVMQNSMAQTLSFYISLTLTVLSNGKVNTFRENLMEHSMHIMQQVVI